jgi:integrase/recombinase XerD
MAVQIDKRKGNNGTVYLYLRWTEDGKRRVQKTGLKLTKGMLKREKDDILSLAQQMKIDKETVLRKKSSGRYTGIDEIPEENFILYLEQMVNEKDRDYWRNTLAHVRSFMGKKVVNLGDITPEWCLDFQSHLKKHRKKNGTPLEPATIEKYLVVLNSSLRAAVNNGLIPRNPMMNDIFRRRKIKVPEKPVNFLQVEDLRKLIQTAVPKTSKDVKEAFLFSVFTGLRISDIDTLTFGQVKNGAIHITMQKTETTVYIPIVDATRLLINHQRLLYPEHQDADRIFQIGWKNVVNKPIEKWRKESGLSEHFSFHSARRTCATYLFNIAECEERVVKGILGHKLSRKDVFARYASVSDKLKRDALKVLSDLFIEDLQQIYCP